VYFDVEAFNANPNHTYAKLCPGSQENPDLRNEGEGSLTDEAITKSKRGEKDFALWKKSKPDEPVWPSQWGEGRPGWHIECSAMASAIFKEKYPMDIHSGGIDLKFPHHDNEIAQSEAYYNFDQWVNNFWHAGHLHIDGLKMSKSLKNFITIKAILEKNSMREVRWLFLIHNWNNEMTFDTEKSFVEAVAKNKLFTEFFRRVDTTKRTTEVKNTIQKWSEADVALDNDLTAANAAVYAALADIFDTPTATYHLGALVSKTNSYLDKNDKTVKVPLIRSVSKYILSVLKSFGLYEEDDTPKEDLSGANKEETITPFMNTLSTFRDEIKARATEGKGVMFERCDDLRYNILPSLGIRLKDKKVGEAAVWDFVDPAELLKEQEVRNAEIAKKAEAKRVREAEALKKNSTQGKDYFKVFQPLDFKEYDADGVPTVKKDGKEVKDNESKKLKVKMDK